MNLSARSGKTGVCHCRLLAAILILSFAVGSIQRNPVCAETRGIVLQTDFGLKDGAVAAMKGVIFSVDSRLPIFDLTHEIPPFDIWEGAYRLRQAVRYWPSETVFVSVVDPGVGTDRKSVVLRSKTGHYFITPDNGTLTLIADELGIDAIRQIDESANRLQGSALSHTFHGRDVYAYTGARLASGVIRFSDVGPVLPKTVVSIPYQKATYHGRLLSGTIPVLDPQFGNVWSNVGNDLLDKLNVSRGDLLRVRIMDKQIVKYAECVPYVRSFGDVPKGKPLLYLNSLLNVSVALNLDSFAESYGIESGSDWTIHIKKCR